MAESSKERGVVVGGIALAKTGGSAQTISASTPASVSATAGVLKTEECVSSAAGVED
jgi:hypothetical protein